jgi:hypothetical protein
VVTVSLNDYPEYSASYTVKQSGAADMLDVLFNTDGTADDVSQMAHTVVWRNFDFPLSVAYDAAYGRNVAIFNPQSNGTNVGANHGSYYNVDYAANDDFQSKLADGHSFECVVKFDVDYTATVRNYETKFFSSQGAGGTGFMVANQSQGTGVNGITFLPNIATTDGGGSRWIWTNSQIKPDGQSYYHLVGVWNKTEGKAYIYVNGEKKSEVEAAGFYRPTQSPPRSLGIGGDPGDNYALEGGLQGKIVIARIYDNPLTEADAQALYNEINPKP